jgi:5-methylcytosine-specific restriction endonuclease McrBC regulatory subunit McrC
LNSIVTVIPVWENDQYQLKADSRVGAVTINSLRVQILPRLSASEFCTLLSYAISGKVPPSLLRSSSELTWDIGFENALGMLLCNEVNEIRRIGLSRRYEEHIETIGVLRGKPLWDKCFPLNSEDNEKICCRYHRLTYDNTDNRMLHAGLKRAWMLVSDERTKAGLLQHLKVLSNMATEDSPDISQFEKAEHEYNRLNRHYKVAHELSRMFLFSLRPTSIFNTGPHIIPGVILNMAELFERFVERFMIDFLGSAGFKVKAQPSDYRALMDGVGHHYASVRPDLEVWRYKNLVGVIDAKYKPYWRAKDVLLKPFKKIANEDLYQLFFYQQRLQHRHNLAKPPAALIAAPLPEIDERNETPVIPERYSRVVFQAGGEKAGEVRLILVPVTRFVRLIKERNSLAEAIIKIRDENLSDLLNIL